MFQTDSDEKKIRWSRRLTQINADDTCLFNRRLSVFIGGAILLCLAAPAFAQWINYPTAGVPRLPNGKPNLAAPAPRSADGKPDFSGIWGWEDNRPCPPDGCPDQKVGQEFINIGWSVKGGLPFQPWAAALAKERNAANAKDDPQSHCLPRGALRIHTDGLLKQIAQAAGLLAILPEGNAGYRQIFTDGRPLPDDPTPSWNGYSSGKWEGDTLVVQSNGFRDGIWLEASGAPLAATGR